GSCGFLRRLYDDHDRHLVACDSVLAPANTLGREPACDGDAELAAGGAEAGLEGPGVEANGAEPRHGRQDAGFEYHGLGPCRRSAVSDFAEYSELHDVVVRVRVPVLVPVDAVAPDAVFPGLDGRCLVEAVPPIGEGFTVAPGLQDV